MWKFIKGIWVLIIQLLGFTAQTLTAVNTGMDSLNLALTIHNNTNNIKNKKPLDTNCIGSDLKTLAYHHGILILAKQSCSAFLDEQHQALVEYVESLNTPPKYLDFKSDVENLIKCSYSKAQKDFITSMHEVNVKSIENTRNLK